MIRYITYLLKCFRNFRVFISYSHRDKYIVNLFTKKAEHNKIQFFIDERNILLGENITRTIFERGILKSQIVLVFLSENSISSPWVQFEILMGVMLNKVILPVFIDNRAKEMIKNISFINIKNIKYITIKTKLSFDILIEEIKKWRLRFCLNYATSKTVSNYGIFLNENDFYDFASKYILPRTNNIIFKANTPALLLKSELYTPERQEYMSRLLWEYSNRMTKRGVYMFNYQKTVLEVKNNPKNINYARKTLQKIEDSYLTVHPIDKRIADILPSAILGENHGLIILRDPIYHEFAGVAHISGKILRDIRGFYYTVLSKFHIEYNVLIQLLAKDKRHEP